MIKRLFIVLFALACCIPALAQDDASAALGPKLNLLATYNAHASVLDHTRALYQGLDQLVQARVKSRSVSTPPGSPTGGDAFIVATGGTGAWSGKDGKIAFWNALYQTPGTNTFSAQWIYLTPGKGWLEWIEDESIEAVYDGSAWNAISTGTSFVTSFNSRNGAVTPTSGDYTVSQVTGAAPAASPTFTGTVTIPTVSTSDNSTAAASTAFVKAQSYLTSVPMANPSASVGLTAINGSSTSAMRADAAPALNVGIAPTWTNSHQWDIDWSTAGSITPFAGAITMHPLSMATALNQYNSPFLRWVSYGWNPATSTPETNNWVTYAVPIQTAGYPESYLHFLKTKSSLGSPLDILSIFSSGGFQLSNSATPTDPGYGVFDAATGFKIAGAATSGNYLRGNGTNFVSAGLAAADLTGSSLPSGITGSSLTSIGTLSSLTVSGAGSVSAPAVVFGSSSNTGFYNGTSTTLACAVGGVLQWSVNSSGVNINPKLLLKASSTSAAPLQMPTGTAPTSPALGEIWHDATQKTLIFRTGNGINTGLVGTIYQSIADVTTTSTSTTSLAATSTNKVGSATLPANFWAPGKTISFRASGSGFTVPSFGTFVMNFAYGSTTLATTGSVTPANNPQNGDGNWVLVGTVTCRTIGASGSVYSEGKITYTSSTGANLGDFDLQPTVTTIDTTSSNAIDLQFKNSSSGSITCKSLNISVSF